MKQLDPISLPELDSADDPGDPYRPEPGSKRPGQEDDFPNRLAEALDILVDRAMRHGLVEVAHLLEVTALAARDAAILPVSRSCQSKRKRNDPPSTAA